jgi:SAM-dependent methyltransferase
MRDRLSSVTPRTGASDARAPRCAACGATALRPHLQVATRATSERLTPTTDRFGVALGNFARCSACGHCQLDPMPAAGELEAGYREAASADYESEERGQRATARAELRRIERHVAGPGRLVDLGCWVGFLPAEAALRGWQAAGVEPSAWAAERARARGVQVVVGGLLDADLPERAFAAVTMGDVLEHLPDPGAALERVARILAPDGVLWIATPDAGSLLARALGRRWWSVIPTHVQLFTRRSIKALLERHDFEVLDLGTSPKSFSVAYYLGRLGGYSPAVARGLVAIARRLGLAERLWTPDFGDRMAVVARPRRG